MTGGRQPSPGREQTHLRRHSLRQGLVRRRLFLNRKSNSEHQASSRNSPALGLGRPFRKKRKKKGSGPFEGQGEGTNVLKSPQTWKAHSGEPEFAAAPMREEKIAIPPRLNQR
jgi:hypothetical protein